MKSIVFSLSLTVATCLTGCVMAQPMRPFDRLDTNDNGYIEKAELIARRMAAFDRADSDKDGVLTPEEIEAARSERRRRSFDNGADFAAADSNGDGRIDRQEAQDAPLLALRADQDGDGRLSREELQDAMRRLRDARS